MTKGTAVATAAAPSLSQLLASYAKKHPNGGVPAGFNMPEVSLPQLPRLTYDQGSLKIRISKDDERILGGDGSSAMVVVVDSRPTSHRAKYDKVYDPADPEGGQIICWSSNGQTPDPSSTQMQSASCRNCPFAGKVANGCARKQRVVLFVDDDQFQGLAAWDINYTSWARPVGLTSLPKHKGQEWHNLSGLFGLFTANGAHSSAFALELRKDQNVDGQNKIVAMAVGFAPDGLAESFDRAELDRFLDVSVRPSAKGTVDGAVASPSLAAAPAAPRAATPAAAPAARAARPAPAPTPLQRGAAALPRVAPAAVIDPNAQDAETIDAPDEGAGEPSADEIAAAAEAAAPPAAPAPAPRTVRAPRAAAQAAPAQAAPAPAPTAAGGLRPGSRLRSALRPATQEDDM